jgi:hypothetical protein
MINATKPPPIKIPKDILSPLGLKRYFVVHGGLFSKDEVTLEDIRKIDRIGKQPGQEGLMCEVSHLLSDTPLRLHVPYSCSGLTPRCSRVADQVNG